LTAHLKMFPAVVAVGAGWMSHFGGAEGVVVEVAGRRKGDSLESILERDSYPQWGEVGYFGWIAASADISML